MKFCLKPFAAVLVAFLLTSSAFGMIDPKYKEAMQRGYPVEGDSVVLPNGKKCQLNDFNLGLCGVEYQVGDYCVGEGRPVWDEGKCCSGLEPWLPEGEDGQATCEKSSTVFWLKLASNPIVWAAGGLLVGAILFTFIRRARGINRH